MKALTSWSKSPSRHCLLFVDDVNREHDRRAAVRIVPCHRALTLAGPGVQQSLVGIAITELVHPVASVARWQNLIPSFPWIAPEWRAWGRNPRKGRDQILQRSVAEP